MTTSILDAQQRTFYCIQLPLVRQNPLWSIQQQPHISLPAHQQPAGIHIVPTWIAFPILEQFCPFSTTRDGLLRLICWRYESAAKKIRKVFAKLACDFLEPDQRRCVASAACTYPDTDLLVLALLSGVRRRDFGFAFSRKNYALPAVSSPQDFQVVGSAREHFRGST